MISYNELSSIDNALYHCPTRKSRILRPISAVEARKIWGWGATHFIFVGGAVVCTVIPTL